MRKERRIPYLRAGGLTEFYPYTSRAKEFWGCFTF